jgi:hypothetical protein
LWGLSGAATREGHALKPLVKAGQLTGIAQFPLATHPRRMGFGINIQIHGIPRLAPRGAGFKRCPIGHDNRNFMVFGVDARFHNKKASFKIKGVTLKEGQKLSRIYLLKKTLHTGRGLCMTGFVLIAPTEVCKGNARKALCQRFWGLYAK